MFTNTRLFKVSAEAWTPASSWHQGCLLPRCPGSQSMAWEDKTPSGSLVHSWPRKPCRPPPSSVHGGVEPSGTADPLSGRRGFQPPFPAAGLGLALFLGLPRLRPGRTHSLFWTQTPEHGGDGSPQRCQARSGGAGAVPGRPRCTPPGDSRPLPPPCVSLGAPPQQSVARSGPSAGTGLVCPSWPLHPGDLMRSCPWGLLTPPTSSSLRVSPLRTPSPCLTRWAPGLPGSGQLVVSRGPGGQLKEPRDMGGLRPRGCAQSGRGRGGGLVQGHIVRGARPGQTQARPPSLLFPLPRDCLQGIRPPQQRCLPLGRGQPPGWARPGGHVGPGSTAEQDPWGAARTSRDEGRAKAPKEDTCQERRPSRNTTGGQIAAPAA